MALYVGINNKPKEVVSMYIGVNNVPKEVTTLYSGGGGTELKTILNGKVEPGQSIFASSGTFTVPKGVKEIEVFLVGGGGNGSDLITEYSPGGGGISVRAGGGGGYTKTQKIKTNSSDIYNITIGAATGITKCGSLEANPGSTTTLRYTCTSRYERDFISPNNSGGSGGGAAHCRGGSNGSNGGTWTHPNTGDIFGTESYGQGSTTRAFGESSGTLYSGGGGGEGGNGQNTGGAGGGGNGGITGQRSQNPTGGGTNTGGGGGGGNGGTSGGSGIAIIRWGY